MQHSWCHLDFQLSKVHSIIELCKEVQVGMNYSKYPSLWMFLEDKILWGRMYGEVMVYKENLYVNWHYEMFGLAFVIKQNWTTFGEEKDQESLHSFKLSEQKVYLVYSWIQKPTNFTKLSPPFGFWRTLLFDLKGNMKKRQKSKWKHVGITQSPLFSDSLYAYCGRSLISETDSELRILSWRYSDCLGCHHGT